MKNKKQWLKSIEELEENVSPYSNHILRHILLPEILGEDEENILYWAGKAMARKINAENGKMELAYFFKKADWGTLTLLKEKKHERLFELVAPHMLKERPFTLECGFLAQWVEIETGFVTEAAYEVKKNKPVTVRITARWDPTDPAIS